MKLAEIGAVEHVFLTHVPVFATTPAIQTQIPSVALVQVSEVVNPPHDAGTATQAFGEAIELVVQVETYALHSESVNPEPDGLFVHDLTSQAVPATLAAQAELYS